MRSSIRSASRSSSRFSISYRILSAGSAAGSGPGFASRAIASARTSSSRPARNAVRSNPGRRPSSPAARPSTIGAEQLAREGARQQIGPERVGDAGLLVGDQQQQAQQLRFDRGDRPQDLLGAHLLRGRADRLDRDPRSVVGPPGVGSTPLSQRVGEDARLESRTPRKVLEVGLARDRDRTRRAGRA